MADQVERYLSGADRDQLGPFLDTCASAYLEALDEYGQVDFRGEAKAFSSEPTVFWRPICLTRMRSGRSTPFS